MKNIKKLLILLSFGSCFAAPWDSVSSLGNTAQCTQNCDPGAIMKTLNVQSEQAKSLSTTACQVSCGNDCFAKAMANAKDKSYSETAALQCKDSLKKSLNLN